MEEQTLIDKTKLKSLYNNVVLDHPSYCEALRELRILFKDDANLRQVLERGLCLSKHYKPNVDLLWMGINPSYDERDKKVQMEPRPQEFAQPYADFDELLLKGKKYWSTVSKIILGENDDRNKDINKEHLDLFSVRNTRQEFLHLVGKSNLNNDTFEFLKIHIWFTQQFLENYLKPKVIVLANKASGAYLGLDAKYVWMGYKTEEVPTKITFPGNVYKIIGIRDEEGLIRPKPYRGQLNETLILHARFQGNGCPKEQQIETKHIEELLRMAGVK